MRRPWPAHAGDSDLRQQSVSDWHGRKGVMNFGTLNRQKATEPKVKAKVRLERLLLAWAVVAVATACVPPPPPKIVPPPPPKIVPPPPIQLPVPAAVKASSATTPLAYRKDAAAHLYSVNSQRIMKGKLQANLYAVGVLQLEVGPRGEILAIHWLRAPRHAPEVVREIERTVRAAEPFPVPVRIGKVTYTDTWLWDKSGKFQLDTLTEGQN